MYIPQTEIWGVVSQSCLEFGSMAVVLKGMSKECSH